MTEYHEPESLIDDKTRDFHRALKSLQEELEAADWYTQRIAASTDADLRDLLSHNRDEEIEHACMLLEWLRRRMPGWERQMRTYLFTEGPIHALEEKSGH